jgi:hypothetical protein
LRFSVLYDTLNDILTLTNNQGDFIIMSVQNIQLGNGFLGSIIEKIRTKMIPFQLSALKNEVLNAAPSCAIKNFEIAAGLKNGEFHGMVFQDSDIGKWIEAAAYSLMLVKNPELENEIDKIIDIIASAQQSDGYLNTYFTLKEPDMKWKNLRECHEMYVAGHLIEGAAAYFKATGKDKFLTVMRRNADCIYEQFGPGKTEGYPGHPELELALYRLSDVTGDKKYTELAALLLNRRGMEPNYFLDEYKKMMDAGEKVHWGDIDRAGLIYTQSHEPIRQQKRAVGHSVRALYLYAGMTDEAILTNDTDLINALDTLWDNVVNKQMYITGGLGSTKHGEAFAEDYELPNDTAYAETCASIAFVFWAKRMLKLHRKSEIADEMERMIYNTILAGANLEHDRYYYVNPLEVIPGISGISPDYNHALPERPAWFGCACCPPNMARLMLSLYDYAYDLNDDELTIHLYVDGTAEWDGVKVTHTGNYPWEGELCWNIICDRKIKVMLRIPAWGGHGGGYRTYVLDKGEHSINLSLNINIRRIYTNPAVRANANCVALMRGPLVYCFESIDNPAPLCALRLPGDSKITAETETSGVLKDMTVLKMQGLKAKTNGALYAESVPEYEPLELKAVPYFAWANRGLNEMRVWVGE